MENKLEEFEIEEGIIQDNRTFTEKTFFNVIDNTLTPKKIVIVDCPKGDPETYPMDRVMLMRNYKTEIERGRKDPLKTQDVIVLLTDKGPYMIPLSEASEFASYLYSVANSLKKSIDK